MAARTLTMEELGRLLRKPEQEFRAVASRRRGRNGANWKVQANRLLWLWWLCQGTPVSLCNKLVGGRVRVV